MDTKEEWREIACGFVINLFTLISTGDGLTPAAVLAQLEISRLVKETLRLAGEDADADVSKECERIAMEVLNERD